MLVGRAAANCLRFIPEHISCVRDPDGIGLHHAKWMLNEIKALRIEGEKAHRWLGYAQGILVQRRAATLEQMKEVNVNA